MTRPHRRVRRGRRSASSWTPSPDPFPGPRFFDLFLHAPPDEVAEVNDLAIARRYPTTTEPGPAGAGGCPPVDRRASSSAGAASRPAATSSTRCSTPTSTAGPSPQIEIVGIDPAADPRRARHHRRRARPVHAPVLPRTPRSRRCCEPSPSCIADAVEELLRLDAPFVAIARTATRDTEIGGHPVEEGEKVLIYWASANRDEAEFPGPDAFDPTATQPPPGLRCRAPPLRRVQPGPHEPAHRGRGARAPPRRRRAGRRCRARSRSTRPFNRARRPWCPSPSRRAPDSVGDPRPGRTH